MKVETLKYIRLRKSHIITSGGGKFDVRIWRYIQISNTFICLDRLKIIHIDCDKIVSIQSKSLIIEASKIAIPIISFMVAVILMYNYEVKLPDYKDQIEEFWGTQRFRRR